MFGYGSLIWRPDFDYHERRAVRLHGWVRRFWQGSHDHRGVPQAPGRVVTLVKEAGESCDGVAYRIAAALAHDIFEHLDHREKNGYERRDVTLHDADGDTVQGVVYIATPDNEAWLGPAAAADIAAHIERAHGPSGANRDYLLELAAALRIMGADDRHVFELESLILAR